ncbi:hypothetical protein [Butyrivibrio sp. AE3009]|uniref:hypothetical protein n=1 Tax=Butyrivibrio sp. AE3009 TaxID=1280666 RepID=UPI0003B6C2E6|nr:hypothetical protein [Butyrivibrio sp. AE3009]
MSVRRLRYLSESEDKLFQYNSDIMNECFGGNYTHYFNDPVKEVYGGYVWFPKERVKARNGEWLPGSKEVNWKNYVDDNGKKMYMYLNPGETIKPAVKERPTKPEDATPCFTFLKSDRYDGYYKYVGTFMTDLNASTGDRRVLRKLRGDIDLSIWCDGINSGYYEVEGNPALEHYYLFGDFKKHKKTIESYDHSKAYHEYMNKTKELVDNYSLARIIRLGEDSFKADYCALLIKTISDVYGEIIDRRDLYPLGKSFQEIGMAYYELLSQPEDYNGAIRHSVLTPRIAGMIMGVYDPYYYIYGLNEEKVNKCIKTLGLSEYEAESIEEKICMLYFWKQCMCDMDEWSIPSYYAFISEL